MGIRSKIALGFILLTITVISLVLFWGAQSLGFTVDSSDLIHLENIKNNINKQISEEQKQLDQQAQETKTALLNTKILSLTPNQQSDFLLKLKENLSFDYINISIIQDINSTESNKPIITRLSELGPLSYKGFLISETTINENNQNINLKIAKTPSITTNNEVFCIFDDKGILAANGFLSTTPLKDLHEIYNQDSTKQIKTNQNLYRLRGFNLNNSIKIITGYSTQVPTLVRSEINSMMLRLAILEIIGFLILGYFWWEKIFAPMKTLKESIDNVSQEKWQEIPEEITNNSYEEIASVAQSFNQMVKQLSSARTNLIEAQKKMAIQDKMATLGRFSAGIAHEINNPLGTILMSAGMINESINNNLPIEKEDIKTIIDEVKRCRDIIENLRTYTKKTKPNLIKTSFKDFFDSQKSFILQTYSNITIKINFDFKASLDTFINVDKKAMDQVFNNIIKNAIEASDNNVEINIIADETETECSISIRDNGKGFECGIEHIFEPMYTTKAQGTGIGLLICQSIVEGHHGSITAHRLELEGLTCFDISLPKITRG